MMKKTIKLFGLVVSILLFTGTSFAAEKVYFYHTDAAGTPVAMTDVNGNVVWRADYKPFGEEQSITPSPENNKRFIGKEKDEETGLYYFGARYMDAGIGRFTSPDPAGISEKDLLNPQRLNRYNYGLNNPHRYVDSDGEHPVLLLLWAAMEVGLSAYDAYDTTCTVLSSEASPQEKGVALGLFGVGLVAPGGGYSKIDDIAKTFAGGKYRSLMLKSDVEAYRYSGGEALEQSNWLTTKQTIEQISSAEDAKRLLNLPARNTAEELNKFIIPEGTEILIGRVAGGGEKATQIFIKDPSVLRKIP